MNYRGYVMQIFPSDIIHCPNRKIHDVLQVQETDTCCQVC